MTNMDTNPLVIVIGDPRLYREIAASPDIATSAQEINSIDDFLGNVEYTTDAALIVVGRDAWRSGVTLQGLRLLLRTQIVALNGVELEGVETLNDITLDEVRYRVGVELVADITTPALVPQGSPAGEPFIDSADSRVVPPQYNFPTPIEPETDTDTAWLTTAPQPLPEQPSEPTPDAPSFTSVPGIVLETQPQTISSIQAIQAPSSHGGCVTIMSWSSKGGVGKTTVAVNLAGAIASMTDRTVCIVDLDVEDANVGSRIDLFSPTVTDALALPSITRDALLPLIPRDPTSGVWAILGPRSGTGQTAQIMLSPGNYSELHRVLTEMFDVVVLDCPIGLNAPLVGQFALQRADVLIAVIDTERSAIIGMHQALKDVVDTYHFPRERIGIVINQQIGKKNAMPKGEMLEVLQHLPVLAEIMDNRDAFTGAAGIW